MWWNHSVLCIVCVCKHIFKKHSKLGNILSNKSCIFLCEKNYKTQLSVEVSVSLLKTWDISLHVSLIFLNQYQT